MTECIHRGRTFDSPWGCAARGTEGVPCERPGTPEDKARCQHCGGTTYRDRMCLSCYRHVQRTFVDPYKRLGRALAGLVAK